MGSAWLKRQKSVNTSTRAHTRVHSKHRVIVPVSTVHLPGFTVGPVQSKAQECVPNYACFLEILLSGHSCGVYNLSDKEQTFSIFHRSPDPLSCMRKEEAHKSISRSHTHTHTNTHTHTTTHISFQVFVWWVMASTSLSQQLCNYNLWGGITVSAIRNEWTCTVSLIPPRISDRLK